LAAVPGHVHPAPSIDTSVSPVGTVSVTVTVPLVGPAPAAFDTVTLYVAPFCPWVKFPAWLFAMFKAGGLPGVLVKPKVAVVLTPATLAVTL
jgi:hypothetical protein